MKNMQDDAILRELGSRLHKLRLRRDQTQTQLSARSGVARRTIQKAEDSGVMTLKTLVAILRGLDALEALDQFLPDAPVSPLQLAKLKGKERQRASGKRSQAGLDAVRETAEEWKWGE